MSGTRDISERQLVTWGFRLRRADRMRRAAIRRELARGPFMGGFEQGLADHEQDIIRGFMWPSIPRASYSGYMPPESEDFEKVVM